MLSKKYKLPKSEWVEGKSKFVKTEGFSKKEKQDKKSKLRRELKVEYLENKAKKRKLPMNKIIKIKHNQYDKLSKNKINIGNRNLSCSGVGYT